MTAPTGPPYYVAHSGLASGPIRHREWMNESTVTELGPRDVDSRVVALLRELNNDDDRDKLQVGSALGPSDDIVQSIKIYDLISNQIGQPRGDENGMSLSMFAQRNEFEISAIQGTFCLTKTPSPIDEEHCGQTLAPTLCWVRLAEHANLSPHKPCDKWSWKSVPDNGMCTLHHLDQICVRVTGMSCLFFQFYVLAHVETFTE